MILFEQTSQIQWIQISLDQQSAYKQSIMLKRKQDKSMARIYKDLVVTKRQLIDLRQSISKNVGNFKTDRLSLKPKMKKTNQVTTSQKTVCYNCGFYHDPAVPHNCLMKFLMCEVCDECFGQYPQLQTHKQEYHRECNRCHRTYNESERHHDEFYCGERRVECERCLSEIKVKDIDNHHLLCCFEICFKCKKSVYFKGLSYHLRECRQKSAQNKNKIKRSLKIVRTRENSSNLYPSSLAK